MGEQSLWSEFLDERVEDLQKVLLMGGVNDLMSEFENWLYEIDAIDRKRLREYREIKRDSKISS